MAAGDINVRDLFRLRGALKEAYKRSNQIPPMQDLIPALTKAFNDDGSVVENLVVVFGEPVRSWFSLLRDIIAEKHGEAYAEDLWQRAANKDSK